MRRVVALLVVLLIVAMLAGCGSGVGVRAPTATPAVEAWPADLAGAVRAPLGAVAAPAAPVLLGYPLSHTTNVQWVGVGELDGGPAYVWTDFVVRWRHASPPGVNRYEVWRATSEPYFEPGTCSRCALAATTTGLRVTIEESPGRFNPVGGTAGTEIQSEIDTYVVRAVNAGGTSEISNRIGVFNVSLIQGAPVPVLQ